jgi:formate-dependent nitrite reductase cytochrome c552 subunit
MMRPIKGVRKTESLFLPAVALAGAAVLSGGIFVNFASRSPRAEAERPRQLPGGGYASSDTCRACHPSQYASWHASYHRTMTQLATPSTVLTSFDGVTVDMQPSSIHLERDGQALWATFADPDDGSPEPRVIRRQVVMTTGSHNQQIYWYATGNSRVLGQLPAIWLTAEQAWIARRAAIMAPPSSAHVSETGAWNGVCIACHTTDGRPELDAPFGTRPVAGLTAGTRAAEFGIACESCHGPGEAHARANRNPLRRYGLHFRNRGDDTIVQPAHLDPRRSSQVCGQCHSFWEFPDAASERQANADGLPYRPGEDLAATRLIVQPGRNLDTPVMQALLAQDAGFVRDTFWSDGMVRATGREYNGLLESPCYRKAPADGSRTMTCFSCHAMHKTPDDRRTMAEWAGGQMAATASGNGACVGCHRTTPEHSHHSGQGAESPGTSCVECHMPHTTYGLLKTIRSHQISSPSVAATLATGRPNACNLCHLDKTLAWTADNLERWYGIATPALSNDERSVAASVMWLLKGDAGQRAIVAQAMGRLPAQQASGSAWLAPYLALTQKDRYDAVRIIATRSLKTLPAFRRDQLTGNPELLINADGTFDAERVNRLVRARDNRRLVYRE